MSLQQTPPNLPPDKPTPDATPSAIRSWFKRRMQKATDVAEDILWGAIIVGIPTAIWFWVEGAPLLIAIGAFSALALTFIVAVVLRYLRRRANKGLTAKEPTAIETTKLNERIEELENKNTALENRWNAHVFTYKRVLATAESQKEDIDHYVILTKITTGDQELTADVPYIIFGLEVRNESIFDISIDIDVENSHVFFGEILLSERKIRRHRSENVPPGSTGTVVFEQRLSSPEAALISKSQSEANTKFRFTGLVIIITGGTDYPQVVQALPIKQHLPIKSASCL